MGRESEMIELTVLTAILFFIAGLILLVCAAVMFFTSCDSVYECIAMSALLLFAAIATKYLFL